MALSSDIFSNLPIVIFWMTSFPDRALNKTCLLMITTFFISRQVLSYECKTHTQLFTQRFYFCTKITLPKMNLCLSSTKYPLLSVEQSENIEVILNSFLSFTYHIHYISKSCLSSSFKVFWESNHFSTSPPPSSGPSRHHPLPGLLQYPSAQLFFSSIVCSSHRSQITF